MPVSHPGYATPKSPCRYQWNKSLLHMKHVETGTTVGKLLVRISTH
jgi:hypothetical protein